MPEGDTIFRAARTLHRALAGKTIQQFDSPYPHLSRVEIDSGVIGRTVEKVEAAGKWLLIHFSGDLILLTHMLMNGSWHIYRPGETWQRPARHMRVMLATNDFVAVAFTVQIAEFHTAETLRCRGVFNRLGPSVLSPNFSENEQVVLTRLLARPDLEVGVALLKQNILSGIGNVYKSEICFAAGVNPFRSVKSLTTDEALQLLTVARTFMMANVGDNSGQQITTYSGIRRTTGRSDPSKRLWVYQRKGEPCRRCSTPIESRKQGLDARVTFWCPQCQPHCRQARAASA